MGPEQPASPIEPVRWIELLELLEFDRIVFRRSPACQRRCSRPGGLPEWQTGTAPPPGPAFVSFASLPPSELLRPLQPPNQLTLQQVVSFHRKSVQQSPPLSRRALLSSDQFNGPFESSDPATTPDRRQLENRPREPVRSYRAAACAATATGRSTRMRSAASPTKRAVRRAVRATPRYVSIGLETRGRARMLRGLRAKITGGRWARRGSIGACLAVAKALPLDHV